MMSEQIERIREMERCFDLVQSAAARDPGSVWTDARVRDAWRALLRYYEGGQWLADYQSDERGELPATLKRGVLSEDGVWNLLTEIEGEGE